MLEPSGPNFAPHPTYRAEVTYNGVKYRKRSAERADCEQFLAQLAEKYEKGLL